jgi:hypothetical protein
MVIWLFYSAMVCAAGYFLHRLAWLVHYRTLLRRLVARATQAETLEQAAAQDWDEFEKRTWRELQEQEQVTNLDFEGLVRDLRRRLHQVREALHEPEISVRKHLARALSSDAAARELGNRCVARIPAGLAGKRTEIRFDFALPRLQQPRLDPTLFSLRIRSRYGLMSRLAVLFIGAADVVLSSTHVAQMSQNAQVPWGVILRRLSLVALILVTVIVDVGFGIGPAIMTWSRTTLSGIELDAWGETGHLLTAYLPDTVGMMLWAGFYGAIYFSLWGWLWWRSRGRLRELRVMEQKYPEVVHEITQRHQRSLLQWADEYGRALDDSVRLALRQAEMLIARTEQRIGRAVAPPELLQEADAIAAALFGKLPEASTQLQDGLTAHQHSWQHMLWPRPEEMQYQITIARHRFEFREIDWRVAALRSPEPNPATATTLWRIVRGAVSVYPELGDDRFVARLEDRYRESIRALVRGARRDFDAFDERLKESAHSLAEQFRVARSAAESQIELTQLVLEGEVAALNSRILKVREQARIEAMAFEI